jgi:hypothetical protein
VEASRVSELDSIYRGVPRANPDLAWRASTNHLLEHAFAEVEAETPATSGRVHGPSWEPVDLVQLALEPPSPPTIVGLIYPGRRHVFQASPRR